MQVSVGDLLLVNDEGHQEEVTVVDLIDLGGVGLCVVTDACGHRFRVFEQDIIENYTSGEVAE